MDRARERIIDIASTKFPDGGCYHQYQPLTKKGNADIGGDFSDDQGSDEQIQVYPGWNHGIPYQGRYRTRSMKLNVKG